jgi:GNAT superfamily N-acetyltransferase
MLPLITETPRFKIIDSKNKELLTNELIEQMSIMNTIDHYSSTKTKSELKSAFEKTDFKMCLAFIKNEFVGFAFGELSENTFRLNRFFVNPKTQGKKIGTKLLLYFYAYLNHKHKVNTIKMTAYPGTHEINKKLIGEKEITIIREEKAPKDPTKKITRVIKTFRNFNNSSYIYTLSTKPIIDKTINGREINSYQVEDKIHIKKNPRYKKRVIRSRAK